MFGYRYFQVLQDSTSNSSSINATSIKIFTNLLSGFSIKRQQNLELKPKTIFIELWRQNSMLKCLPDDRLLLLQII